MPNYETNIKMDKVDNLINSGKVRYGENICDVYYREYKESLYPTEFPSLSDSRRKRLSVSNGMMVLNPCIDLYRDKPINNTDVMLIHANYPNLKW